jgi:hypothetical protein
LTIKNNINIESKNGKENKHQEKRLEMALISRERTENGMDIQMKHGRHHEHDNSRLEIALT